MTEKFWQSDRPITPEEAQQRARYKQRMQAAASVLGLPLTHCDEEIERAFFNMEEATADANNAEWSSKQTKKQLKLLRAALEKVRIEHGKLPQMLQWQFVINDEGLRVFDAEELSSVMRKHVKTCDQLLELPANTKSAAIVQRQAAWEARILLRTFGQRVQPNRTGKWCRLAAVLYGDEAADLSPYCRALRRPRPNLAPTVKMPD